ncbi:unnamed protein product [Fraxinus pennsylvanica]|uniref:Uncharacterized protein n=1 Tax=Fraxinus pennsylvanica TaxID=56036 RepID=A0AAD1Z1R8_9LAMI|nr:unnamed protein product [Fraxinus pennsylvanica]
MLIYGGTYSGCSILCRNRYNSISARITNGHRISVAATTAAAATIVFSVVVGAGAIEAAAPQQPEETLSNIPQTLSSVCTPEQKDCKKKVRIQRPKSKKAEKCTSKCVSTCILGGFGSPGEGPLNIRRPLVVFKDGFRSRQYCLSECSDICNLIGDGDDGP